MMLASKCSETVAHFVALHGAELWRQLSKQTYKKAVLEKLKEEKHDVKLRTTKKEYISTLKTLYVAYKRLKTWFEETVGVHYLERSQGLIDD